MNLQYLCTNCLAGTLQGGICTYCKKDSRIPQERHINALPDRYMLGTQYYLGKVIGSGGFGITYLAYDCRERRRVIIKELYPRQDVQRDRATCLVNPLPGQEAYYHKLKQRFREEAQLLYSFRHEPSILDVYWLMETNNTVYYAMEYLTGKNLKEYMRQYGRLGWAELSVYIRSILYTLNILHGRNLIHRDISPDNIFLTSKTQAKLIDFGSARHFNSGEGLTVVLKGNFAPIEQYFTNGNQGAWTDIYSLSVTIYYALSGKLPPKAPERAQGMEATEIGVLCPELPDYVSRSIMKGMALKEGDRFQSVAEMAKALFPKVDILSPGNTLAEYPPSYEHTPHSYSYTVQCTYGQFQGLSVQLLPGSHLSIGRSRQCNIHYPDNSPGISRKHLSLWCDAQGALMVRDEGSTYGTTLSGHPIKPGIWYIINKGNSFGFANEIYYVE